MFRRTALWVIAAFALPSTADADCALIGLDAKLVTPAGAAIPKDGGLVVAALSADHGELAPGDPTVHPEWSMADDSGPTKRSEQPTIVTIAPGLAVYRRMSGDAPPAPKHGVYLRYPPHAYEFELHDGRNQVLGTFSRASDRPRKLAAPKVKRVRLDTPVSRRSRTDVIVELSAAPPKEAYALVLTDRKGVARSWGTVAPDGLSQTAYHSADCLALPNGTVASRRGDKIKLFWLTLDGRRSPASGSFTISASTAP